MAPRSQDSQAHPGKEDTNVKGESGLEQESSHPGLEYPLHHGARRLAQWRKGRACLWEHFWAQLRRWLILCATQQSHGAT